MKIRKCIKKHAARLGFLMLSGALMALMAGTALADEAIRVFVDNQEIEYGDSPPMVINDRVMVGVRSLALALGVPEDGIAWDGDSQTVSLTKDDRIITLMMGSWQMWVNDKIVYMDTPPALNNERIYLPARYVSEVLGYSVSWDQPSSSVIISSSGPPPEVQYFTPNYSPHSYSADE